MISMEQTKNYLAVLAKVMQEKPSKNNMERNTYYELYRIINSEFKSTLQKSSFPNAPDIAQKMDELTDSMESLFLCPDIIGKTCVSISNYGTNKIFEQLASVFMNGRFIFEIYNIFSQIPLVILDSDQDSIEAINYANERISLTVAEYKLLVIESNRKKIALNKIIKVFIIKTTLRISNFCIISDNSYMVAGKMFERAISHRVLYLNQQGIERVIVKRLYAYDALVVDEKNLETVKKDRRFSNRTIVESNKLAEHLVEESYPLLYGYLEHYKSIEAEILGYYSRQYKQNQNTLREILGDIVRLGNSNNNTIQAIRNFEENKKQRLEKEKQEIESILSQIEKLVVQISHEIDDILTENKRITTKTYNSVFKTLFFNGENSTTAQYVLSKLVSYGYKDTELVECYIKSLFGQKVTWNAYDVNKGEWAKAKMLLQICDLQVVPKVYLENWVKVLGNRISTGKEYYAKAMISNFDDQITFLMESFDEGYEQAGYALLDFYKYGYGNVNLMRLVNALVPEACMILAEQNSSERGVYNHLVSLDDQRFVYYKLAATKQYAPAIGAIVDAIYESRFSNAFQFQRDSENDLKNKEALENGYAICQLCRFLIDKMYNVQHYSEVLGVVLFCLNVNHSESMTLLAKSHSGISYYCRGNMYEFGAGVSKDLEKALSFYETAQTLGWKSEQLTKRKASCKQKIKRKQEKENSTNYYQSTQSYSSSYHSTGSYSDDGCFAAGTKILMGDYTYKNVEKLSVGDLVIVYDHYKGVWCKELIVANVHNECKESNWDVISLEFSKGKSLDIVNAHGLYDLTLNKYVLISKMSVDNLIGHEFVTVIGDKIERVELISYSIWKEICRFYAPISKMHLNVVANDFLTMPPIDLTLNLFPLNNEMKYDFSLIDKFGITPYEKLKDFITKKEYDELPCKYLDIILAHNPESDMKSFTEIMNLYRS